MTRSSSFLLPGSCGHARVLGMCVTEQRRTTPTLRIYICQALVQMRTLLAHDHTIGKGEKMSRSAPRFRLDSTAMKNGPEKLNDPQMAIRQNGRCRYIWELRSDDGHVVNRSDDDFPTLEQCQADAHAHGHS